MPELSCREPPPVAAEQLAAFSAAAKKWPGGEYDVGAYGTAQEALDAYESFHAHALSAATSHKSLVFVPNQYGAISAAKFYRTLRLTTLTFFRAISGTVLATGSER